MTYTAIALIVVLYVAIRGTWLTKEIYKYETFMPNMAKRLPKSNFRMIAKFWIWDMEKFMNYEK